MVGKTTKNAPKIKAKTTKELTEEVENLKKENNVLKKQMEELGNTVKGLFEKLNVDKQENERAEKKKAKEFKCKQCDEILFSSGELKDHRVTNHPMNIECKHCDENFTENSKLENHLKTHREVVKFNCEKCKKEFCVKWRLRKHMEIHGQGNVRKCHYYNNNKTCPFEEIGCKFAHIDSEKCYFQKSCRNKLCQFKHDLIEKVKATEEDNAVDSIYDASNATNTTDESDNEDNEENNDSDDSMTEEQMENIYQEFLQNHEKMKCNNERK